MALVLQWSSSIFPRSPTGSKALSSFVCPTTRSDRPLSCSLAMPGSLLSHSTGTHFPQASYLHVPLLPLDTVGALWLLTAPSPEPGIWRHTLNARSLCTGMWLPGVSPPAHRFNTEETSMMEFECPQVKLAPKCNSLPFPLQATHYPLCSPSERLSNFLRFQRSSVTD